MEYTVGGIIKGQDISNLNNTDTIIGHVKTFWTKSLNALT